MKVAIIGRTQILFETARKIKADGHEICCIITAEAAPEYSKDEKDFEKLAKEWGIPFVCTNTLNTTKVKELVSGADIGVSINWVSVVTEETISKTRLGILNGHHGDLPKYRGNACSNWAIILGDSRVTKAVHFMSGGELDCGKVIAEEYFSIEDETTIADIYDRAAVSTPDLFVKALRLLEKDENYQLRYADPNSPEAFRCFPRLPEDGFIEWDKPALQIHNLIRAVCRPFPGAYTYMWEKGEVRKLYIYSSRLHQEKTNDIGTPGHVMENNANNGESLVMCGEGVLAIDQCRYSGESEVFSPGKRWRSIRKRLGVRSQDWLWHLSRSGLD